eukprot:gb/GFBE01030482.1/.p1 GENE.gb/GFBE01030482.1/~~gb/GFBE01030482.1/.p1  ORF type:complete len:411 (+),score=85.95 gb/GFBE01030482.1/:1-1233(+)
MPFADAQTMCCEMPIKHTFIHFSDDLIAKAALERSATCPQNFAPAASVMAKAAPSVSAGPRSFQARLKGRRPLLGDSLQFILAAKEKESQAAAGRRASARPHTLRLKKPASFKLPKSPPAEEARLASTPEEDDSTEAATSVTEEPSVAASEAESEVQSRLTPTSSQSGTSSRDEEHDEWTQVPLRKKDRRAPLSVTGKGAEEAEVTTATEEVEQEAAQEAPKRQPATSAQMPAAAVPTSPTGSDTSTAASSSSGPSSKLGSTKAVTAEAVSSSPSAAWERPTKSFQGQAHREEGAWAKRSVCRYEVGIPQCEEFNVMRRLLVPFGGHMRRVAEATGAKLCVRGKGSGHLEGLERKEAAEPLMICITSSQTANVPKATQMVEELLRNLQTEYGELKRRKGEPVPEIRIARI